MEDDFNMCTLVAPLRHLNSLCRYSIFRLKPLQAKVQEFTNIVNQCFKNEEVNSTILSLELG